MLYGLKQVVIGLLGGTPRSPDWPRVRAEHIRKHPFCAACGGKVDLEVHHVKPFHLFPELELDPTNLMTLCGKKNCHIIFGHCHNWSLYNAHAREDAASHLTSCTMARLRGSKR